MSDDKEQEDGELLQATESPESADADANDSTEVEASETEQEQEGLDLEDESPNETPSKAEEQKLKQIKATQKKVDSGAITIDDLPADQKWKAEYLKPKYEVDKDAIKKVLQDEKEADRFKELHEGLEDADLSSDKVSLLNAKFKNFRSKGLSKLDALESAMEIAQVDLKGEAIAVKKHKMRVPKPGSKSSAKNYKQLYKDLPFSEAQKVIPAKELDKILAESIRP
jgi:hypothetical protein|tara:strand:- start:11307 stop:11981 length:675 start_codon:yes stop_codon:yes gene_type:complete